MNKNKQTNKYGDPLYLKCEEIVDKNISQLFENKKKLKLVENGDNEVLTCLIFNIVAYATRIMPLDEIKDAVKTGTNVVIEGYMKRMKKDGSFDFQDDNSENKVIN